ncbi:hypothetical protein ACFQZC_21075 [Streptacidiphilus monticola]
MLVHSRPWARRPPTWFSCQPWTASSRACSESRPRWVMSQARTTWTARVAASWPVRPSAISSRRRELPPSSSSRRKDHHM